MSGISLGLWCSVGLGLSLSLAVTSSDGVSGVTNNGGAVLGVGGGLLTGGGDDLLAMLGDGGVHDLIILLVTLLPGGHHLPGVAGLHGDGDALGGGHSHGGRGVPVATSISVGLWSSLG